MLIILAPMEKEFVGDSVRAVMKDRGVTYPKLVEMFAKEGITDPDGDAVKESLIKSYAYDRARAPSWFVEAFAKVLGLPTDWIANTAVSVDGSVGTTLYTEVRKVAVTSVPFVRRFPETGLKEGFLKLREQWRERIVIPHFIEGGDIVAVGNDGDLYMPHFRPGDVLLVDISAAPKYERVLAYTDQDGHGGFGLFVWADGKSMIRPLARESAHDLDSNDVFIDGLVVGRLYDYRPGRNRGIFDDEGLTVDTFQ